MKVLIINQYFYPDIAATAQLITNLAEDLVARNLQITVLTSRSNYLGGQLKVDNHGTSFDANIIRVRCTSYGRRSLFGRFLDYISFYFLVLVRSLALPKHDVVLVLTTPPLLSFVGLILKIVKGSKYVCLVEDLYPDTAVALGLLAEKSLSVRVVNSISNKVYVKADSVIAISKSMKDRLVNQGAPEENVVVVDNWADKEQIYPIPKADNWFAEEHGLCESFTVEYSGNMGLAHDFDTILKGTFQLRDRNDIKFLFVGDGVQKDYILNFKNKHDLNNVIYLPYQDRADLAYSISAGDVGLISLKRSLEGCIVPCKLYGIMAAARPVIFVGGSDSDIAEIIQLANCGFQTDEGDVDSFIRKVDLLSNDRKLCEHLGQNGYLFFLENFERKRSTAKYYDLLTGLQ